MTARTVGDRSYTAEIEPEFDERNCKILGLSVDSVDDHERWSKDIKQTMGQVAKGPIPARIRLARSIRVGGSCSANASISIVDRGFGPYHGAAQ